MATYLELQERVQRRVIDLPSAVQTEVPSLVKSAVRSLQIAHNFKVMEALISAQQTVAATRDLVAVPSAFKEFRGRPYRVANSGTVEFLDVYHSREDLLKLWETDDDGEPRALLLGEQNEAGTGNIEVWPLSDSNSDWANGEYRIYIPYWRFLTELSGNSDTNWLTVNADDYIVDKATADAFALDWDYESMALWLQRAENWKFEIIKRDKLQSLVGVSTLVPVWQGTRYPRMR